MFSKFLLASILFFSSFSQAAIIFRGPTKNVGAGKARSWVVTDNWLRPQALGITMTAAALQNLPTSHAPTEYVLRLPRNIHVPPYNHLGLDWNAAGHEPDHVYTLPHFDLHFYMMSLLQRSRISCAGADLARCERLPAAKYIPANYIQTPGGVPRMGAHWVDPRSGEFNGQTFTATLIYGIYNGQMRFLEPMFTKAFLQTKPNLIRDIPQPQAFQRSGYYPLRYQITYHSPSDTFTIALRDLRYRRAN